jgi:predicted ATPase
MTTHRYRPGMTGIEPFVGRVAERAALRAELAFAGAGQPRVVMIEGDAGIGKSTLFELALCRRGGSRGHPRCR